MKKRHKAVRIRRSKRAATSRKIQRLVAAGYSPRYAAKEAYHPKRDGRDPRLSAAQLRRLPSSAFALPKRRALPIHNAAHVRNAAARLEQMCRRGTVTITEYRRAHARIRARERRLGIGPFHR